MLERLQKILFGGYLLVLIWILLFKMSLSLQDLQEISGPRVINWIPLAGSATVNGAIDLGELGNNFLIFLPLGGLLGLSSETTFGKKVGLIISISIGIEACQYFFALGRTDMTDVLTNSFGGLTGLCCYNGLRHFFPKESLDRVLTYVGGVLFILALLMVGTLIMANF